MSKKQSKEFLKEFLRIYFLLVKTGSEKNGGAEKEIVFVMVIRAIITVIYEGVR